MITVDFETKAIEGNPLVAPPEPVGVSILIDGKAEYMAWGHPTENNCTKQDAYGRLQQIYTSGESLLFHNKEFDLAVGRAHFDLVPTQPADQLHDTMFMLFLADPYASTFALKPSAHRVLGLAPDEQTELRDWVLRHVRGSNTKNWGAYISETPGGLAGKYADGDTIRTYGIYEKLAPYIRDTGMWDAYVRELRLAPILTRASVKGVRVDMELLQKDVTAYSQLRAKCEQWIFKRLGREFEMSKGAQLADALDAAGAVDGWEYTPTGRRSTARPALMAHVTDKELLGVLEYHGIVDTCLRVFAEPWLALAAADGRVHPQWNQVRSGSSSDMTGARTGRLSCKDPNLMNPPNNFEGIQHVQWIADTIARFNKTYRNAATALPYMMQMRSYLLPEEGQVWVKRDWSAQEMRIMAHFEEGALYERFKEDPYTDPHDAVKEIIHTEAAVDLPRKHVKITGFGIMYGRGIPNLSAALGVTQDIGRHTRDAYYAALPGVRALQRATGQRGREGGYITTWGGRIYYREPHPTHDMSYKLLNYLIQGSAADQTKQCTIEWDEQRQSTDNLLALVHDEVNIGVDEDKVPQGMQRLRQVMEADRFDVPMRSEGFVGKNWASIKEYGEEKCY